MCSVVIVSDMACAGCGGSGDSEIGLGSPWPQKVLRGGGVRVWRAEGEDEDDGDLAAEMDRMSLGCIICHRGC